MKKLEGLHKYRMYRDGKECRELIYVDVNMIEFTNSQTDEAKIQRIAGKFDASKCPPVTGRFFAKAFSYSDEHPEGKVVWVFKLTDGNHRCKAMIQLGVKFIPAVPLSQKEYDHVAYSNNGVEINVARPLHPFYIVSGIATRENPLHGELRKV